MKQSEITKLNIPAVINRSSRLQRKGNLAKSKNNL